MKIAISRVCSAFEQTAVGSRVTHFGQFLEMLPNAIHQHECDGKQNDRTQGQYYIPLGEKYFNWVSAGIGVRSEDPNDYIVRNHRGTCSAYLKREKALRVDSLAVIIYTRAAYEADPQVDTEEMARIGDDTTHIIVAVLASAGEMQPQITAHRLMCNLAGGNRDIVSMTKEDIIKLATDCAAYNNAYSVVAD